MKKTIKILLLLSLVLTNLIGYSQTYTSSTSGDWETGSTWVGGTSPTLTGGANNLNNDVTIEVGDTVILNDDLTIKSGINLIVRGMLLITGDLDFQNGSIILVETGGELEMNSLNNSNNSTNVTINGTITVNGNYVAGTGASLSGVGGITVVGTTSGSGLTFGTNLNCTNCSLNGGAPLPIELLSFIGFENNGDVNLEWVVLSQINNDYFTIEHSSNGYVWGEIAKVDGLGNSSDMHVYYHTHRYPTPGINYYRLSQTDFDGKFETFKPLSVEVNAQRKSIVGTYNMLGQPVNEYYRGFIILLWDNGERTLQVNN